MRKKILITLLMSAICLVFFNSNLFADVEYSWQDYGGYFYLGDELGVEDADYVFDLGETPWVHLCIPREYFEVSSSYMGAIGEKWTKDGTIVQQLGSFSLIDVSNDFTLHKAFENWDGIKAVSADWEYDWGLVYDNFAGSSGYAFASANYSVAPEPISSLLFVIGGASLAAFGYKKRKKRS